VFKPLLGFCAVFFAIAATAANSDNCKVMAQMVNNIANLRHANVPLAAVEQRLKRDVVVADELALGLIVASLVYSTQGKGQQLKNEVLKKCK
jgi:hypothetical protein